MALPSQDYYLKASSEGDLQAYHKYMVSIAVLLGANATTAEKELQDVVKFEMQLANVRILLNQILRVSFNFSHISGVIT